MKKTLIATLVALAVAASASAADYTLGEVTYTTTTGVDGMNRGNYAGFTFTLSDTLFATSTVASTTASDGSSSYASTTIALDSITLAARDNNYASTATKLVISDSTGKVVASTTTYTQTNNVRIAVGGGYYTRALFEWDFDAATTSLTVGSTYTVTFQNEAGGNVNWGMSVSNNGDLDAASVTGASSMQPAYMSIVTQSTVTAPVPEPATATLSLLALAGLAARRRRK